MHSNYVKIIPSLNIVFVDSVGPEHVENLCKSNNHVIIVNADGIYLTIYSALLLNLKLFRAGYYKKTTTIPVDRVRTS